ncbi:MAG TPA: PilT/PilU family type 4a pilus ATPase [Candidatus Peribacteraceae bacterium]|nr:PilT/PilU family type 4a pilus ATPase [Candidatus Peribacteraceae bacterium]
MPAALPNSIFQKAFEAGASDVHVAVDAPLLFRIDGKLVAQTKGDITASDSEKFVKAVLSAEEFKRLNEAKEIDVSYSLSNGTRLRINCHFERGNLGLVARVIPNVIPSLDDIDLTPIASRFLTLDEGLILFTGPTGTGKSTSLAAMLQTINQTQARSIVTMEDPIEFLFPKGMGVIRQRQLGQDFTSFAEALKRVLRQDPDIVMVGEMRDPETISAALTLAETGHLILATLHTPNTIQTVDRIIDVFPPYQQPQIRSQLSMSLKAVVSQRLLAKEGGGRIAQREVLINTPAAANTIRDNRLQELKSVLQTGADTGMISFEKDAKRLLKEGLISKETYELALQEL